MPEYTAMDKLKEVERELYWRNRVYPNRIKTNSMTKKMADKQIAIMEAIAEDYRRRAKTRAELPLDDTETPLCG